MTRYAPLQRIMHWLMAVIVLGTLAGGLVLGLLGFEGTKATFGGPVTNAIYEYHKTFGLIILALMIIRLFLRFEYGKPAFGYSIEPWERIASSIVQFLLYLALFAQPILGWLATDAANFPVEFFAWNLPQFIAKDEAMGKALYAAHGYVGWTIVVLLILHIGGALRHWLIKRDEVMARMSLL